MDKIFKILKNTIEFILIFTFIIFELLIWDNFVYPIKKIITKFISESVTLWIESTNKYIALFLFLLPFIVAETLGIISGLLIAKGLIIIALIIYFIKIVVAALSFWIFAHTKSKLLSINWFKKAHDYTINFLNWIKSLDLYLKAKDKIDHIKAEIQYNKGVISYFKVKYKIEKHRLLDTISYWKNYKK